MIFTWFLGLQQLHLFLMFLLQVCYQDGFQSSYSWNIFIPQMLCIVLQVDCVTIGSLQFQFFHKSLPNN
jgi:hypothetical protein